MHGKGKLPLSIGQNQRFAQIASCVITPFCRGYLPDDECGVYANSDIDIVQVSTQVTAWLELAKAASQPLGTKSELERIERYVSGY